METLACCHVGATRARVGGEKVRTMSRSGGTAIPLVLLLTGSAPALAQPPSVTAACDDHAEIARQLRVKYQEAPVSLGLQSNGYLLEVFSSRKTGTWTIVSVAPNGEACVVAAGEHWEMMAGAVSGPAI
jgi:hypothetical protein